MKYLTTKIYEYVRYRYPRGVWKGELERYAMGEGVYGDTCARRCREFVEKGTFEKLDEDGKTYYKYIPQKLGVIAPPKVEKVKLFKVNIRG